ncbi:MAG: ABC transporter ATP-binding protein [Nitrospirae bacterium]|nr:ABC transporter ATP-binding protein [Nitrospirota bacterium]
MLLKVEKLRTQFFTSEGVLPAVDNVSFSVDKGKILGIVGESGCGKSVTGLSIMRLVPPPGKIVSGGISFDGQDILKLSNEEIRNLRGNRITMVFQDPMTSLNPVFTIGNQIAEILRTHKGFNRRRAMEEAATLLQRVGIPDSDRRVREYPHQMSGGMRQRVMIAMAVACDPALIIADEPTTALDVTIQAQILRLLKNLVESLHTALILISHDLGVIAETADDVAVMYAGKIVEYAATNALFKEPLHPYTIGLLESIPQPGDVRGQKLRAINGFVPRLTELPEGCKFSPRCKYVIDKCRSKEPELIDAGGGHFVRCWEYKTVSGKQ